MWIPLRARWDQEPAGSLVVPTPKKIAGSVAGEREGKGGEEKGGKIGGATSPRAGLPTASRPTGELVGGTSEADQTAQHLQVN